MITERTLKKWRKEALQVEKATNIKDDSQVATNRASIVEWQQRILRMTQVLLDQHLMRKK